MSTSHSVWSHAASSTSCVCIIWTWLSWVRTVNTPPAVLGSHYKYPKQKKYSCRGATSNNHNDEHQSTYSTKTVQRGYKTKEVCSQGLQNVVVAALRSLSIHA